MPDLFGRPIPPAYSGIDADLVGLETHANVVHKAIAENLRIDDRVSDSITDSRATRFLSRWQSSGLLPALTEGHKTAAQEFSDDNLNANNIFFCPRLGRRDCGGSTRLVTIQSLHEIKSRIGAVLRTHRIAEAQDDDLGDSRSASLTPGGDNFVDDWLDRHADGKNSAGKAELQNVLAEAIEKAYPPPTAFPFDRVVWVGLDDEFKPHENLGARRWLEVFGLGHFLIDPSGPHPWFAMLKYQLKDVAVAARPCVLEAEQNPWHFPTPASRPAAQGGKTVILGDARIVGVRSMTEFVHLNRRVRDDDIVAISRYVPRDLPSLEELKTARDSHRASV